MTRPLRIAAVQAEPLPIGSLIDVFAGQVHQVLVDDPDVDLVIYPELHLFGAEAVDEDQRNDLLRSSAVPLNGTLVARLGAIARAEGIWLLPGSVCELGAAGELYNTAVVFSPEGDLVASYRKIFPWRPYEPYVPGDQFVVFDMPGVGRFGLTICYDAWFPEVSRHVAWMGAEAVLNVVKTTTPDRAQEVILAQANSIVNQTFTISVNCAGPIGEGRSLFVDPEGHVTLASGNSAPTVLIETIDLDHVTRVHERGTAGFNRMWSQFLPTDAALELPLYNGRITPVTWSPAS
jgi:predicted amidohydrolase